MRSREWVQTEDPQQESPNAGGSSSSAATGRGWSGQSRGRGSRGRGSGAAGASAGYHSEEAATAPVAAAATSLAANSARGISSGSAVTGTTGLGSGSRASAAFRTDTEISNATGSRATSSRAGAGGQPRQLQAWVPVNSAKDEPKLIGTLEELSTTSKTKQSRTWDQFEANRQLFGVTSTYKNDLSQYTTPLNEKALPAGVREKAKQIAEEIENRASKKNARDMMDCGGEEEEEDEEDLWSAVPRNAGNGHGSSGWSGSWSGSWDNGGKGNSSAAGAAANASEDGGLGGALLASLRAGSAAAGDGSLKPAGCDYRSRIAPKVQSWWRARISAGASVPLGADGDVLVCPFSQRVFGDVSQLVTHWAAALPRATDANRETSTPCGVATEQFRLAGRKLRWTEMATESGLDNTLPVSDPKMGSVWAQVVTKLQGRRPNDEPVGNRFVSDFVDEAVQMRCWRRDQKVEHREVLEGIAAGLALHVLGDTNGSAWSSDTHQQAAAPVSGDGRSRGDGSGAAVGEAAMGVWL